MKLMGSFNLNKISFAIIFSFFGFLLLGLYNSNTFTSLIYRFFENDFRIITYSSIFIITCIFSYINTEYAIRVRKIFFMITLFFLLLHKIVDLQIFYILFFNSFVLFLSYCRFKFDIEKKSTYEKIKIYKKSKEIFEMFSYWLFFYLIVKYFSIFLTHKNESKMIYNAISEINVLLLDLIRPENDYYFLIKNVIQKSLYDILKNFYTIIFFMLFINYFLPTYKEIKNKSKAFYLYYYYIRKNLLKALIICFCFSVFFCFIIKILGNTEIYLKDSGKYLENKNEVYKFFIIDLLHIFIHVLICSKFYYKREFKLLLENMIGKIYVFFCLFLILFLTLGLYNICIDYDNKYFITILNILMTSVILLIILILFNVFFGNKNKKNAFMLNSLLFMQIVTMFILIKEDYYDFFNKYILIIILLNSFILRDEIVLMKKILEKKISSIFMV